MADYDDAITIRISSDLGTVTIQARDSKTGRLLSEPSKVAAYDILLQTADGGQMRFQSKKKPKRMRI